MPGFHHKGPAHVHGARRHLVACRHFHGHGFAGKAGHVDGRGAFRHHAVHGNARTGPDEQAIPRDHGPDRHLAAFSVFAQQRYAFGRQIHQPLDRIGCTPSGNSLQILAQRNQGNEHARRFIVQAHDAGMRGLRRGSQRDFRRAPQAVQQRRARPHGDQTVHVRRSPQQKGNPGAVEIAARPDHGQGQKKLGKCKGQRGRMRSQPCGQRQSPVTAHGDDYQRHGEHELCHQTPAAQRKSGVAAGLLFFPCVVFIGFRRNIRGFEPQRGNFLLHLSDKGFLAYAVFGQIRLVRTQKSRAPCQVHGNGRHARHGSERPLRTRGTCRAAHAVDTKTHVLRPLSHKSAPFFLAGSCQEARSALVYLKTGFVLA